jgi:hypothetical protein
MSEFIRVRATEAINLDHGFDNGFGEQKQLIVKVNDILKATDKARAYVEEHGYTPKKGDDKATRVAFTLSDSFQVKNVDNEDIAPAGVNIQSIEGDAIIVLYFGHNDRFNRDFVRANGIKLNTKGDGADWINLYANTDLNDIEFD